MPRIQDGWCWVIHITWYRAWSQQQRLVLTTVSWQRLTERFLQVLYGFGLSCWYIFAYRYSLSKMSRVNTVVIYLITFLSLKLASRRHITNVPFQCHIQHFQQKRQLFEGANCCLHHPKGTTKKEYAKMTALQRGSSCLESPVISRLKPQSFITALSPYDWNLYLPQPNAKLVAFVLPFCII